MRNLLLSLLIFGLVFLAGTENMAAQHSAKSARIWVPDASQLSKLGGIETVEEFTVRPPNGYKYVNGAGPDGSMIYGWSGPKRSSGTAPQFLILIFSPESEVRQSDMEPGLAALLASFADGKTGWKLGPIEHGVVNGLPFVRTRWEGYETSLGYKVFGFSYLTIVGKKVIHLSSQDVEPFQTEALALAEAAARTFSKK
jgi:hypothetical protein